MNLKKCAVIGLGGFGTYLVKTLAEKDVETIAIDKYEQKVNEVKDIATKAITLDATIKENLVSVGIHDMDSVVVSTGPTLEPSIIIVHILKELGIRNIVAKALSAEHEKILDLVGATEVSFPERDIAVKIGNKLTSRNLVDYISTHSGFAIHEIAPPDAFVGKTLAQVNLRKKYNVTVVAIKSIIPDELTPNPGGEFLIKESDILIIFGTEDAIQKFESGIGK